MVDLAGIEPASEEPLNESIYKRSRLYCPSDRIEMKHYFKEVVNTHVTSRDAMVS